MQRPSLIGLAFLLVAASDPQPPLGEPVNLHSSDILAVPSDAVASAVLDLVGNRPLQEQNFNFVCMASAEGAIFDCLHDTSRLGPRADWREFDRVAGVNDKMVLDHSLVALARLQARRTILRPRRDGQSTYLVRLSQQINPERRVKLGEPTRLIAGKELVFESSPNASLMSNLYPMAALRHGAEAQVIVRCRVQLDRSLFCHSGKASEGLRPGDAEDFVFATYQLWSFARVRATTVDGKDAIGAEAEILTAWRL